MNGFWVRDSLKFPTKTDFLISFFLLLLYQLKRPLWAFAAMFPSFAVMETSNQDTGGWTFPGILGGGRMSSVQRA